jgi:hypothetical protein
VAAADLAGRAFRGHKFGLGIQIYSAKSLYNLYLGLILASLEVQENRSAITYCDFQWLELAFGIPYHKLFFYTAPRCKDFVTPLQAQPRKVWLPGVYLENSTGYVT